MGAALCNPHGGDVPARSQVVEAVPSATSENEVPTDSKNVGFRESKLVTEAEPPAAIDTSPPAGDGANTSSTASASTDAPPEAPVDTAAEGGSTPVSPKPVLQKKKSILKRSGTSESASGDTGCASTRTLQIVSCKHEEQAIPMKTDDEKDLRISYGNQDIKRTGTYATLGLGYLINATMHEMELSRRSKVQTASAVFPKEEDATQPGFSECYTLQEEIASGGFGTVYHCVSKAIGGRQFAVKQVSRSLVDGCKACEIFNVEATVLKDIEHPHLAWRLQVFQSPDVFHVVMDWCRGPSLFEKLCDTGTLPRKKMYRLAWQIASGLQCLHENGIMHRDIKPENILFVSPRSDAQVYCLPGLFSFARQFKADEQIKTQVGTLAYVAPEMFWGAYREKIDIWALGCTLFLCVSGCQPMHSRFDDEMCRFIMEGRIAWYLVNWLDNDALTLMKSCMETDPEARFSAAQVVALPWLARAGQSQGGCCGALTG